MTDQQSRLYPGTSPTPPAARVSVTYAVSASDNPITARAQSMVMGFGVNSEMYFDRFHHMLIPR